ncbi:NtaA/DmoA family FMN-dependent monooxygenase [Methylorubrum populi]
MKKQIILNYSLGTQGIPWAAWRHPDSEISRVTEFDYFLKQAKLAELGCFDFLFWVDHLGLVPSAEAALFFPHDPMQLMSALAVHTEHIGLIATIGTSYAHPFTVARSLASLDHLSQGRAGWNVVTSVASVAARNYGHDAVEEGSARYKRAREFVDATLQLWSAWSARAFPADKTMDVPIDVNQISAINFNGEVFKICGPLSTPRTPQVIPIICQAGPSPSGRELAANYADLVYSRYSGLESSKIYREDLRSRAAAAGRLPDSIKLLPYITPFVKSSEAEALRFYREMMEFAIPTQSMAYVSTVLGVKLQQQDLRDRIPPEYLAKARIHWSWLDASTLKKWERDGRGPIWADIVRIVEMRQTSEVVLGTPERIALEICNGFESGAFDGVSITSPLVPHSLADFVEQVVPLLRKAGIHKDAYQKGTLRDRLGLPVWQKFDHSAWTNYYSDS